MYWNFMICWLVWKIKIISKKTHKPIHRSFPSPQLSEILLDFEPEMFLQPATRDCRIVVVVLTGLSSVLTVLQPCRQLTIPNWNLHPPTSKRIPGGWEGRGNGSATMATWSRGFPPGSGNCTCVCECVIHSTKWNLFLWVVYLGKTRPGPELG